MLAILAAALLEMIGIAFVLPTAACDLDLPDSMKGIITSIPNIGEFEIPTIHSIQTRGTQK